MKKSTVPRTALYAVAVMAAGLLAATLLLTGKPAPEPRPPPQRELPAVDVIVAEPAARELSVSTQGTVRPLREIDLISRVAGRVESSAPEFAEGGFFRRGDLLLKIEETDYRFAIARAESQLAAARQQLAEEEGQAQQARREWRDLGSPQANALFLREPQLASARAALAAAEADLGAARLDLERTRIVAPFNGRISEKLADSGQYVMSGSVVARVYATDTALVRLPLTDRQVALLDLPLHYRSEEEAAKPAAAVLLTGTFGNRDWQWRGRIVRTDARIDEDSRMIYAVAEVADPFAREPGSDRPPLAPGMFVTARIAGRPLAAVTELPRAALRREEQVMLVDARQQLVLREVELLQSAGGRVWVQGLRRGERVVADASGPWWWAWRWQ
ncbi:efflux RND transporter periplasmic adaptor subunit [Kineobactrum salinum]|uniref:Efflux RND transporter periplasmic adaptor subunit n=1 Tax=Kineobactrum salinum TaxID=2708301 RepID=A0A6C0TZZ5_9GAMM|nr:efflux RND transporter periplasmic adaptor subunit [Kineobactrum salinum]QIB65228.1 efflux RND transporter periplasmic adaptor subunit [Kineobactrum salinum]